MGEAGGGGVWVDGGGAVGVLAGLGSGVWVEIGNDISGRADWVGCFTTGAEQETSRISRRRGRSDFNNGYYMSIQVGWRR